MARFPDLSLFQKTHAKAAEVAKKQLGRRVLPNALGFAFSERSSRSAQRQMPSQPSREESVLFYTSDHLETENALKLFNAFR